MNWLHTLVSVGLVLGAAFTPQIQAAISAHPQVAASLAAAWGVLGQILPHADPTAALPQTQAQSQSKTH